MTEKKDFLETQKALFKEWTRQIDDLKLMAKKAQVDASVKFENYIDDNECDIEGINKKLGDIEGFHGLEERYYYDFSCKVVELSKDEIQKLQMIPENVTIYSLDDLEDIGVKNLDLPTIKLLRKLDIV